MQVIDHYVALRLDPEHSAYSAHAAYLACAGTEETDDHVHIFFAHASFKQESLPWLELLDRNAVDYCLYCMIPRNWNQAWEDEFEPVQIGDVCRIRASFHEASTSGTMHEIVVDPKMAFGTGHHETTSMMIHRMSRLDLSTKRVLDYGCGTGILAIFAEMRGAHQVDAIDYDIHSYESTLENSQLNACKCIHAYHGDLERAPSDKYDVILANINRSVLEKRLPELARMLPPDGHLIISGILLADYSLLLDATKSTALNLEIVELTGDWLCMVWSRRELD